MSIFLAAKCFFAANNVVNDVTKNKMINPDLSVIILFMLFFKIMVKLKYNFEFFMGEKSTGGPMDECWSKRKTLEIKGQSLLLMINKLIC